MKKLLTICTALILILSVSGPAGAIVLDRSSSNIYLNHNWLDESNLGFDYNSSTGTVKGSFSVNQAFQLSLYFD